MSVKTSVSSTAQSLSTRPGMLSGPGALRALILLRDLLTLSGEGNITFIVIQSIHRCLLKCLFHNNEKINYDCIWF